MKTIEINSNLFSRSKKIIISKKFIISLTGSAAIIADKKFNVLKKITGLSYVYEGQISPDEKTLLLISNGNCFYIISLDSFEIIKKQVIRDSSMEGNGFWSFKGDAVIVVGTNNKTLISFVRSYNVFDYSFKESNLDNKYTFISSTSVQKLNKHLIIGYNRKDDNAVYILWYDETEFKEYKINNYNDTISNIEYNIFLNVIVVYGQQSTILCDNYGNQKKDISLFEPEAITFTALDLFPENIFDIQQQNIIKNLSSHLELEGSSIFESINKIYWASNSKNIYIATTKKIFVFNISENEIVYSKNISYGVQDIIEIEKNIIAISTWNGVKTYKLVY